MKFRKNNLLSLLITGVFILTSIHLTYAQGVAINETESEADPSAMLDISSTTKGMLVPRMTEAQRDAITSPATGLLIYQTDNGPAYYYYDGSDWNIIGGEGTLPSGASGKTLRHNGTAWVAENNLFNNGTNVGIGTTSPSYKLSLKKTGITTNNDRVLDMHFGITSSITGTGINIFADTITSAQGTLWGLYGNTVTNNSNRVCASLGTSSLSSNATSAYQAYGIFGRATPTKLLGTSSYAYAVGGYFDCYAPTALDLHTSGACYVAGSMSKLIGTYNENVPGTGAIAALIAVDGSSGSATTYAGYFGGDVMITGSAWINGGTAVTSDKRLKKDIQPYTMGLDAIKSISPVSFKYNNTGGIVKPNNQDRVGVLAQDVKNVIPFSTESRKVRMSYEEGSTLTGEKTLIETEETITDSITGLSSTHPLKYYEVDILGVNTEAIMYTMLNAVKELAVKNEEQAAIISDLKARIEALEKE